VTTSALRKYLSSASAGSPGRQGVIEPQQIQRLRRADDFALISGVIGSLKLFRQPEQVRRTNGSFAAISVIEGLPQGTSRINRKQAAVGKAWDFGEIEVYAERFAGEWVQADPRR